MHLQALADITDGLSLEFVDWRLNVRNSNTEPLLRLNVEIRANMPTVEQRVADVEAILVSHLAEVDAHNRIVKDHADIPI